MRNLGIKPADILLPKNEDMFLWATIACDQFTSEPEYWNQLEKLVGGKRSTLNLVLPEIYLSSADEKIKKIDANIDRYLSEGVFTELKNCFILTVRSTPFVERRIGIIGAVDLESYEYESKTESLVRATEGTIKERIPPRLKIRENAKVEFPHIMVLFDDEKREITEELYAKRDTLEKLYDFDLNMGGGRITGYKIEDVDGIMNKFSKLLDSERLVKKYGKNDEFIFAVGDGNHSLATAKTHWNNVKKTLTEEERASHPARFALCEFINVYDEGIYFEPIYRFVTGVDVKDFKDKLIKATKGNFAVYDGEITKVCGKCGLPEAISGVDSFIKEYTAKNGVGVDYVHGDENIKKLVNSNANSLGVLFDKMDKKDLFRYVSEQGSLPRKTFSMGEAKEKRYYLEGKKIVR